MDGFSQWTFYVTLKKRYSTKSQHTFEMEWVKIIVYFQLLLISLEAKIKIDIQFSFKCTTPLPPCFLPFRIWQTWDIAVWGGGESPTFQEENTDFSWCPGCGKAKTEEQAFTEGPTSLWHHYSMYELWCIQLINAVVKMSLFAFLCKHHADMPS